MGVSLNNRISRSSLAEGFSGLAGRAIIVADVSGVETTGRLLRLTTDELTINVGGRERTFTRRQVAAIFVRGDSVKNGAIIGGLSGAALGFFGGTQNSCGDFWMGLHSCSVNEKVANGLVGAAVLGGLSAAIGTGIDAMIPGRRLIFGQPTTAAATQISIVPSVTPSRVRLLTRMSW